MIKRFFEEYKGARRLSLVWSMCLITFVVVRVTEPSVLLSLTASGATVVTAVIGILATVVAFYQVHRANDPK